MRCLPDYKANLTNGRMTLLAVRSARMTPSVPPRTERRPVVVYSSKKYYENCIKKENCVSNANIFCNSVPRGTEEQKKSTSEKKSSFDTALQYHLSRLPLPCVNWPGLCRRMVHNPWIWMVPQIPVRHAMSAELYEYGTHGTHHFVEHGCSEPNLPC